NKLKWDRPLPPHVAEVAAAIGKPQLKILDVGSGPLTVLGTRFDGREISLTCVDPLASAYITLIERYKLTPQFWPGVGFAEDLSAFVESNSFDIVHCRNALDHSFDPVRGLFEIIEVLCVGGKAVLLHHPNEAERNHYDGLHQWNFDIQNGRFVIWNMD